MNNLKETLLEIAEFYPQSTDFPCAWSGHLPFAAWVIRVLKPRVFVELGTHSGNSYFSFCQSVKEKQLNTLCYAVDTWEGDEHAGDYGEEIFEQVLSYNQQNYSDFSKLLRMTFNEAKEHFSEKSVDLLHIDGLHTYDAVKHDFEGWLPKLSPGAVVLFHDVSVYEKDFGVWKLWKELKQNYTYYLEFTHSYGLGVLLISRVLESNKLSWLVPASKEQATVWRFFTNIGTLHRERCEQKICIEEMSKAIQENNDKITELNQKVMKKDSQILNLNNQISSLVNSRSWRITKPLRLLTIFLRGKRDTFRRINNFCSKLIMAICILPSSILYYENPSRFFTYLKKSRRFFKLPIEDRDLVFQKLKSKNKVFFFLLGGPLLIALQIYENKNAKSAFKKLLKTLDYERLYELIKQECNPSLKHHSFLKEVLNTFKNNELSNFEALPGCTVIVPVFNGIEYLSKLCHSLFSHTPEGVFFIFIDDASTDPDLLPFLRSKVLGKTNCLLLENSINKGFVYTVNRAARYVNTPYFVLLNTDVIVPENWLERLLLPFSQETSIASTTPFTNCGVFFSYPKPGEDNPLPEGYSMEEIDAAFSMLDPRINSFCDAHSGAGFCMGINTQCWIQIGPFDDKAFGRGYGEECDWCMRAGYRGWRNVLVPNLFVQHAHGGSFSGLEKKRLNNLHLKILERRWPSQMRKIREHVDKDPWEPYRAAATLLLANGAKGCALIIDVNIQTGGAHAYREKQVAVFTEEGYRVIVLHFTVTSCRWSLLPRYLEEQSEIELRQIHEVKELFRIIDVRKVFMNNLAYCEQTETVLNLFKNLKAQYGFYLSYVFHDFFSICPSMFLLNERNNFCNFMDSERCDNCTKNNPNFLIHRTDIVEWQKSWESFFEVCDNLTCFSQSTKNIVAKRFPISEKIEVVEHALLDGFNEIYNLPPKESPLVVAAFGTFCPQKGSNYLEELAILLKREDPSSKLIFFGPASSAAKGIEFYGPYKREEIPFLLNQYGVKAAVLPSPWPETFSYIAQECMTVNVPFVCFDLGAPAERIRKYKYEYGAIAPKVSALSLLVTIKKLMNKVYAQNYVYLGGFGQEK